MRAGLEKLRELRPEPVTELEKVEEIARETADRELLDLCISRAKAILERSEWTEPDELEARERAYLDFTEQFVTAVGSVSDEQVAALLQHDSPEDVYNFIGSLYALEMVQRLEIVSGEVLQ